MLNMVKPHYVPSHRLFVCALACGFLVFMGMGYVIQDSIDPSAAAEIFPRFALILAIVLLAVMMVYYVLIQGIIFKPSFGVKAVQKQAARDAAVLMPPQDRDEYEYQDPVPVGTLDSFITNEMRHSMGDKFVTLLQTYLIDAQKNLDVILNTKADDAGIFTIMRAAHSLKSASAHIGAEQLANLASGLEADARRSLASHQKIETARTYAQMRIAFDETQKALAVWLRYGTHEGTAEKYSSNRAQNG